MRRSHRCLLEVAVAATLYLKQGNRNGALEAYGHLRSLNPSRAQNVYRRLYPESKGFETIVR